MAIYVPRNQKYVLTEPKPQRTRTPKTRAERTIEGAVLGGLIGGIYISLGLHLLGRLHKISKPEGKPFVTRRQFITYTIIGTLGSSIIRGIKYYNQEETNSQ